MAMMPAPPCRWPGCTGRSEGKGYCREHMQAVRQQRDTRRGSARERGYTTRWEKVRLAYMRQHPLCEVCETEGRVTAAEMVHHIIPIADGGPVYDIDNLCSVCRPCHDRLHSREGAKLIQR